MKAGWETKTLGDVCVVEKCQGIHKNLPYVGLEHIESHTGRFVGSTEPFGVKSSTFKFSPEHVLYGRLRPYLNKVMLPNFTGHCSTEIFPLKPRPGVSREFMKYWFLRDVTVEQINATSTGARMPRANMNAVLDFVFPVPPLPEQQRIVRILDEAFECIATAKANTEKNLQNARAIFESHLQSVFTQRGEGWVEKPLKCITSILGDGLHGTPKYADDGEYHFVNGNNLNDGKIIFKENTKKVSVGEYEKYKKRLSDRTVLVSINGTLGNVAFYNNENIILGKSACYFNLIEGVNKHFVRYVISSPYFLEYAHKEATGATIKNVSLKSMREFIVPLPSFAEQQAIVTKLDSLRQETQRLESIYQQKLAAMEELKKSLLHQAFNGEL